MNAWPSLQTILLDGWIIRMADGYTKRANSINPIYSFEKNLDEKMRYCETIFRKNSLPVIYKIVDCEEQKIIDQKLERAGYEKIDATSVQVCKNIQEVHSYKEALVIDKKFTENWIHCFYQCSNIKDKKTMENIENMLRNIRHDIVSVYKTENGMFAGCGYGVIEKGFVGLFDIIVKEEYRKKGYGTDIVKTILSEAKEHGAKNAYLAVVNDNIAAKSIYEKIGFKETYTYWYRIKI